MKWQPTQLTKLTVGVFGAVIVLLLLVISSISIHFRELEILLQRSAFLQGESGHAHMAAKFINQMKLYRNELSQSQVDEQEVMMDLVMTSKLESANELALALNSIDKMNIALINGLRSFMRQPPLPEQSDVVLFANLQNAFHLERSKEYALALAYYDKIFAAHPNMSEYHKSVIFLHQGFCHMVLGSQAKARVLFLQVMALQKGQGLDITASLLISYLDAILAEKQKIQDTTLTSARKLTHLMQCEQALQILEGLQVANASQRAEAHLLKGLCYEEIGQKPKAIHAYAKALEHHGKAQTAQDANRRLFVMSTRVQSKTRQS